MTIYFAVDTSTLPFLVVVYAGDKVPVGRVGGGHRDVGRYDVPSEFPECRDP